jgi:uncharacterized delta-60 repeat protein
MALPRLSRFFSRSPCLAFRQMIPFINWHKRANRVRTDRGEEAGATGLEPATSGVTGRRSNQLSYAPRDGLDARGRGLSQERWVGGAWAQLWGPGSSYVGMGVLVFLVCFLLCAGTAVAAPGERDAGFGDNGVVRLDADPAAQNVEDRIETDTAGRYLVLATSEDGGSRLLRFLPDGTPDPSFGAGGSLAAPEGTWHDLALRADGGIFLAGGRGQDLAVAGLSADGQLDDAFGKGGFATFHIEPDPPILEEEEVKESFERVAFDPAGRIVAVGGVEICRKPPEAYCSGYGSALARLTPTGEPDLGFGGDGLVFFDPRLHKLGYFGVGDLSALAPQPDGTILTGGNIGPYLLVARFSADGALDSTFSGDGVLRSRFDTAISEGEVVYPGAARAVLVQRSGRIIVVGREVLFGLQPNGELDPGFAPRNIGGLAPIPNEYTTLLRFIPAEAALDAGDRIVLAGQAGGLTAVSRFYPDGAHDPRFGGDGLAYLNLSKTWLDSGDLAEEATDLTLAPDGAPTLAGFAYLDKYSRPALARFTGGDGHRFRCQGKPAQVQGTPGDDRIRTIGPVVALGGDDDVSSSGAICAGAGDDKVRGWGAIYGGEGDDVIDGGEGKPAYGGPGDDVILPGTDYEGRNVFFGGAGDDVLGGGKGPDRLFGGPGSDRLFGGPGRDLLVGGPGADEEHGAGGGGVKSIYRARGEDGFSVRLTVRRNRVSGVALHVRLRCSNGERLDTWFYTNKLDARIHPNGRFRSKSSNESSEGWSESVLSGRVTREKIVGAYAEKSREESFCRTGTRKHPRIDFVARRGSSGVAPLQAAAGWAISGTAKGASVAATSSSISRRAAIRSAP